jgi:hypothetical protein
MFAQIEVYQSKIFCPCIKVLAAVAAIIIKANAVDSVLQRGEFSFQQKLHTSCPHGSFCMDLKRWKHSSASSVIISSTGILKSLKREKELACHKCTAMIFSRK